MPTSPVPLPPEDDPIWAAGGSADPSIVRALALSVLDRRRFLKTAAGLGGVAALAACSPPPPPPAASSGAVTTTRTLPADASATDKMVRFANWTQYIDKGEGGAQSPTLAAFTAKTGQRVEYVEEIDDNDTYANAILPRLRAGQDINRDLVVFSDWMINRLIRDGLLAPLGDTPNAAKNLLDPLRGVSFDPGRKHSLVWQSGFAGIGYNRAKVGREIKSVEDLWAPDLKGKVVLLSEMRDTLGLVMLAQGTDPAGAWGKDKFDAAAEVVRARIADGQVRRVRGNSYVEDFKSGNAVAGMVWSGDISTLRAETGSDDWQFVLPESGGMIWSDDVAIPVTSPHRSAATALIDHYYDPEVAAAVAIAVGYVCPVKGAKEAATKIDPKVAADPLVFPDPDFLAKYAHEFRALDPTEDADYSAAWAKVVGN